MCVDYCCFCFFFKQKTAYEMRISDWSSDVCSSDLAQRLDALIPDLVANGPSQDEVDRAVTSVVANRIKGLEQVGGFGGKAVALAERSEEHTSELQSLMRLSYAVFCLKKKKITHTNPDETSLIEHKISNTSNQ